VSIQYLGPQQARSTGARRASAGAKTAATTGAADQNLDSLFKDVSVDGARDGGGEVQKKVSCAKHLIDGVTLEEMDDVELAD
jgi:hypothetical protein